MIFNSFEFIVFFPIVVIIYFFLSVRNRPLWLLLTSCYFYLNFIPAYLLVLFLVITIDYWAGMAIEDSPNKKQQKLFLILSILSTCCILLIFKYFNFFNDNFSRLAQFLGWNYPIRFLSLAVPIGLSFHTFQSLSYVIEVYRGHQKAERNFGRYSLYVMFFPQLVAGPIERPQHLLPQLNCDFRFDYSRVTNGLKLMFWGFFKKVVIADRLAIVVNIVYNNPKEHTGIMLILATYFFAYQIYCDFSGYTDIARGAARILGVELMENFNAPYRSRSIKEFWQRWHISLSTWFKDYVYIPLGGNRGSLLRQRFNIMITFLISGLWHGANWTFIIWGLLHGLAYNVSLLPRKIKKDVSKQSSNDNHIHNFLQYLLTLIFVCLTWIFFRANTLDDAFYIFTHLGKGVDRLWLHYNHFWQGVDVLGLRNVGLVKQEYVKNFILILFLTLVNRLGSSDSIIRCISQRPIVIRWMVYYILIFWLIFWGVFKPSQFIYFQF